MVSGHILRWTCTYYCHGKRYAYYSNGLSFKPYKFFNINNKTIKNKK